MQVLLRNATRCAIKYCRLARNVMEITHFLISHLCLQTHNPYPPPLSVPHDATATSTVIHCKEFLKQK